MPSDRYVGHRLSDLLALGRETVEVQCRACSGKVRSFKTVDLIDRFGNVVLPSVLSLVTPTCPRRGKLDQIACGALYVRPLTAEEELQIIANRAPSHP